MSMKGDNPLGNKKFRTYKGKRIERPETETEKRDRYFPGSKDLQRLSRGIAEEDEGNEEDNEEDEDCLVDDELSDDDHENDDDCLIPMRWADLATGDKKTRDKMRQTISESRKRVTKKKSLRQRRRIAVLAIHTMIQMESLVRRVRLDLGLLVIRVQVKIVTMGN